MGNETTKGFSVSGSVALGIEIGGFEGSVTFSGGGEWNTTEAAETSSQLTTSTASTCAA